jgi:hypothetical protein
LAISFSVSTALKAFLGFITSFLFRVGADESQLMGFFEAQHLTSIA